MNRTKTCLSCRYKDNEDEVEALKNKVNSRCNLKMQYKTNIKKLIQAGESDTIEFKLSFSDEVIETVVAFSNTSGGSVFIGIDDNGKFVGVKVGQETVQNWLNTIKNKTVPSLIPDIIDRVINGKTVYEIRVNFLAILLLKSLVLIHINRICETN